MAGRLVVLRGLCLAQGRRPAGRARSGALALVLSVLVGLAAAGCGSSGGGSGAASGSASPTTSPTKDPCSLLTAQDVNQVMGPGFPPPAHKSVGTFDACSTTNSAGTQVSLAVPPNQNLVSPSQQAANLKALAGTNAITVAGLGGPAYCGTMGPSFARVAQLGVLAKGTTVLQISADTCDHAVALARLAISRL